MRPGMRRVEDDHHLLSRMCNAGFHKCNRITAEEWQSG
jgi:hypothetical protein